MKSSARADGLGVVFLVGLVGLVALVMKMRGSASWLECASFVTGASCVWLTVNESVWNFPIGMINVATFGVVFLRAGLYADAGLQVVYLVLCARGWQLWLHGGEARTRLHVTRAGAVELRAVLLGVIALDVVLWLILHRVGGSASSWDALTTSLSLGAQWLLNRKRLESWIGWIVADVIYVPLYVYKSLYLTAILYVIFLAMAAMGHRRWRQIWESEHVSHQVPEPSGMGEIMP